MPRFQARYTKLSDCVPKPETQTDKPISRCSRLKERKLILPKIILECYLSLASFEDSSSASIEKAVRRILRLLYAGMELPSEPLTDHKPPKEDRNREIYRRYLEGARVVDLAVEYGISLQRVYVITRMGKRNQW